MSARQKLLLVEDDERLRPALSRFLSAAYEVTALDSAEAALPRLAAESFDAVVCDVRLRGMDGLELLKRVRAAHNDVPFLLMTGDPTLESAILAVEHGAARYLRKPLDIAELRLALAAAVETHQKPKAAPVADGAAVDAAISSLRLAWQPIVSWPRKRITGYEALMRNPQWKPDALLAAADESGRSLRLSRTVRDLAARACEVAPATDLHVNLNPGDLLDEELYDPRAPLTAHAGRIVLEVTERASLQEIPDVRARTARLRKLGYRIAIDDLGAGYAGLATFALLEPEIVKLDASLVRDVHRFPTQRTLIGSLLHTCRELRCTAIAECVELPAERDALLELGCESFQGFLFARPGFAFPDVQW